MNQDAIVIVRLSSLGDIVQALPLAGYLSQAGHLTAWVVEERFCNILELLPWSVEIFSWKRSLRASLALKEQARGFACTLDIQGNWKSGFVSVMLGTGRTIGLAREDLRERGNLLFSELRADPCADSHVLMRSLGVLSRALGKKVLAEHLPARPWLVASEQEIDATRRTLVALGVAPGRPFCALVLGAQADPRCWPMAQALSFAANAPLPCLVLAGPKEAALEIPKAVAVLRRKTAKLEELVALATILQDAGGIAIGHDGGATHVLHAAGAATLVLFGSQDPARTRPFGVDPQAIIVAPLELPCRPCLERECTLPEGTLCMSGISADLVAQRIPSLLR